MRGILLALCALLLPSVAAADSGNALIQGRITDRATGEPLPAAHVRLLHSSRGTITGNGGAYTLQVEPGMWTVTVRMLGYRPDTAVVHVRTTTTHDVALEPSEIVLPEFVVTSEDPAIEIIRRAIAAKRGWMNRLTSYTCSGFTRQILQRDTSIASITESFTDVYWQEGDTLREIVRQRRQTANVKESFNFASVGQILNFNEDAVRFIGYTFVGPTAVEALDYYDYKLLRTERNRGHDIYVIRMIPRTRTVPLFNGTIRIADISYALMGVDVTPNEAFGIPFIKELSVRYRQQFALYQNDFWLPADIRIDGRARISVAGFSFPRIGFEQTSILSDYVINPLIPDSIFRRQRLTVDSSATRHDSTFWRANDVLPLSPEERTAYASLDSTKTLEAQFRPGGLAVTLDTGTGAAADVLSLLDVAFNRVEGLHLGAEYATDRLTPHLGIAAGWAYGFSDRRAKYTLAATLFTTEQHRLGFGAEAYRRMDHSPGGEQYGPLANSITALFMKNDYHNYHEAEGWQAFVRYEPVRRIVTRFAFISERHAAVQNRTSFSLFARSRAYRDNPAIPGGNLRSIAVSARIGEPPVPLGLMVRNALELRVEHATPALASSSFDFTRYEARATLVVPTIAPAMLFRPDIVLTLGAGDTRGSRVPLQRQFTIDAASSGYGPAGVMRAMDVKEYGGTGYVSLHAEHNFRSLPFLAAGIPFLYENQIELLVHGGAARTWYTGPSPAPFATGWYGEIGFGVNRIFDLIRADLTWRLTGPRTVRFTLGTVRIL